jgi:hypothetical protein
VSVLDAYVSDSNKTGAASPDGKVAIVSGTLTSPGECEITGAHLEVAPGVPLRFRVVAKTMEILDDVTFGFVIYRSTDQLVVYNGNVHRRELGPSDMFRGTFTLDFDFRAHLVRGHYYLSVHVFHNPTQTFFIPPQQLATLAIQEQRSHGGVADVEFSASVPVTKELT